MVRVRYETCGEAVRRTSARGSPIHKYNWLADAQLMSACSAALALDAERVQNVGHYRTWNFGYPPWSVDRRGLQAGQNRHGGLTRIAWPCILRSPDPVEGSHVASTGDGEVLASDRAGTMLNIGRMHLLNWSHWAVLGIEEAEHVYSVEAALKVHPVGCTHCGTVDQLERFGKQHPLFIDVPPTVSRCASRSCANATAALPAGGRSWNPSPIWTSSTPPRGAWWPTSSARPCGAPSSALLKRSDWPRAQCAASSGSTRMPWRLSARWSPRSGWGTTRSTSAASRGAC